MIASKVFPTIYNNANYRVKEILSYHPDSMKYLSYWRLHRKRVFEGCWIPDTKEVNIDLNKEIPYDELINKGIKSWRWIPPGLYFYLNFGTILHKPENAPRTAPKQKIQPYLSDFDLAFSFNWAEARGFSGFDEDEEYTCNQDIELLKIGKIEKAHPTCYNSKGELKKYIPTREYLRRLSDKPLGKHLYFNEARNLMLLGSRGGGKEMPDYQEIMTPNGPKRLGDINLNDEVFGRNGKITKVIGIYPQGEKDIYKFTFSDGRNVECGIDHQWGLNAFGKYKVVTTKNILEKGLYYYGKDGKIKSYRWQLPDIEPVEYEEKPLPIHPYILGALLGDGTLTTGTLKLASSDEEIINKFKELLPEYEFKYDISTTNNYTIVYKGEDKYKIDSCGANPLKRSIVDLGINVSCKYKFIPDIYKYGSIEQRFEIVRGLMDTNGSINIKGSCEFTNTSEKLIDDLAYILRSLGIKCTKSLSDRTNESHSIKGHICNRPLSYRLYINTAKEIFYLPRKKKRLLTKVHGKVSLVSIEKLGKTSQRCIMVDNEDKLFLTKDYIPTHNSWLSAIHVLLHEIVTDGSKYYTEESLKNPPLNEIFVGAGIASKSAELASKIEIGMNHIPGVWKKGTVDQKPSPLFKHMSGTLAPNNIKNPWRHEYDKKVGGSWEKFGTGSNIKHGVFTAENPEATAGGRYSVIVIEEVGLMNNVLTAHGSSEATQMTDGTDKYGSTLYIGTGGNVDKIVEAEIIFRDPEGFNMVEFDDEWEGTGKICWFVPAYYMDRKYKDSEGNTILNKAVENYENRRKLKKKAKSSSALDLEMMNYPLVPSEMFLNKTSNNYPIADLKQRLGELSTNPKLLNSTWKGSFIINSDGKVEWKNSEGYPIREFPIRSGFNNIEGCPEMFYPPQTDDAGEIIGGRYIAALDPIDDDDNSDTTTSLQSFFIFDTFLDRIVFEYSGRTRFAKDFYEQCRRALIYYKATMLYENQKKGVFTYFDNKNSLYLLADTPKALKDMDMQKISEVGNKTKGVYGNTSINRWGREELGPAWMNSQALGKSEGVTNALIIKSPALIREAIMYNPNLNTDRISAFGLLMIFRELRLKYIPKKEDSEIYTPDKDPFWDKIYKKNKAAIHY